MKKTLYVSDLDGTLLRRDQTISPFTAETIRILVDKGMLFSYATARSLVTADKVTKGLPVNIPVIAYNGAFIMESQTGKRLLSHVFSEEESANILDVLLTHEIMPIVFCLADGKEQFRYVAEKMSHGASKFLETRKGDVREHPVSCTEELYEGEIFHITCIDEAEALAPLYTYFQKKFPCVFERDLYGGEQWLELHPHGATKAEAVLHLKEYLGCEKLVCFGDGKNDIPMFHAADEAYAMANADEELKRIATAIIGHHDEDGVAKWLLKNAVKKDENIFEKIEKRY